MMNISIGKDGVELEGIFVHRTGTEWNSARPEEAEHAVRGYLHNNNNIILDGIDGGEKYLL